MPYIIGFGGEPATGKSTVMKVAMSKNATDWKPTKIHGYGIDIKVMVSEQMMVTVLGHYITGETFGGTDRMSMSIQPSIVKMFGSGIDNKSMGFWFEGDRLFNSKLLHYIKDELKWPNYFFAVNASDEVKELRHAQRDNQNATWLAGRRTKVANLINEFNLVAFDNNNVHDLVRCADLIRDMNKTLRLMSERLYYA